MANRVTGLQIESDVVRAVVLQITFRTLEVVEVAEERVVRETTAEPGDEDRVTPPLGTEAAAAVEDDGQDPAEVGADAEGAASDPTDAGLDDAVLSALLRLADRGVLTADAIYTAMDVSRAYLTQIALPFTQRAQIEEVLAPQLDGRLPAEVDEMLVDFLVGGESPDGTHLIHTAAIDPEVVARFLDRLQVAGIDPAIVDVEPGPLVSVTNWALGPTAEAIATVEIGESDTNIVILREGRVEWMRSMRAGYGAMIRKLADGFEIDEALAREGLFREGSLDAQLAIDAGANADDAWRTADLLGASMRTILRELRGSLLAHGSASGRPVQRVVLTGEVATLPGLASFLRRSLGIDVDVFTMERAEAASVPELACDGARWANALGIALRGANWVQGSQFNLRKGEFSFRGSLEFLVGRIPSLAAMFALMLAATGFMLLGRVALLDAERTELERALGDLTETVFEERLTSPGAIRNQLTSSRSGPSLHPSRSAFSLFVDVANVIGDLQLDQIPVEARVISVDMSRFLFRVEGIAPTAEAVDSLQGALEGLTCFRNLQRNDLSRNRDGEGFRYSVQGAIDCGDGSNEEDGGRR